MIIIIIKVLSMISIIHLLLPIAMAGKLLFHTPIDIVIARILILILILITITIMTLLTNLNRNGKKVIH